MKNVLAALMTLTSSAALAQAAESTPVEAPAEAPAETPAAPTVDERLTTTEGKVTALEEQNLETKSDLGILKKIKLTGYIQGRYQFQQTDYDEANPELKLTDGFSRFTVRRGRLKATYTGDTGLLMLQIDATPSGVALRDAEATLFIPGTQQNWSFTLGQMKLPFGFEGPFSSSEREFPERSRVVQSFLPGERDRGLRLNGKYRMLRLAAGVFDGNGINNMGFVGTDNDKEKDVVGRLGFDLKWISGGVSGWKGLTLGKRTGDVTRTAYARTRVGADLQIYMDLLPVGGTAFKGEYITGKTYQRSNVEQLGVPASGWWAQIAQNLGVANELVVRYEYFDYENGRAAAESGSKLGATNAIGTLGIAAIHYFGETVKVTAAYELNTTETVQDGTAEDPTDNLFTLQLQTRF